MRKNGKTSNATTLNSRLKLVIFLQFILHPWEAVLGSFGGNLIKFVVFLLFESLKVQHLDMYCLGSRTTKYQPYMFIWKHQEMLVSIVQIIWKHLDKGKYITSIMVFGMSKNVRFVVSVSRHNILIFWVIIECRRLLYSDFIVFLYHLNNIYDKY